jgi:hypothetical protein
VIAARREDGREQFWQVVLLRSPPRTARLAGPAPFAPVLPLDQARHAEKRAPRLSLATIPLLQRHILRPTFSLRGEG